MAEFMFFLSGISVGVAGTLIFAMILNRKDGKK